MPAPPHLRDCLKAPEEARQCPFRKYREQRRKTTGTKESEKARRLFNEAGQNYQPVCDFSLPGTWLLPSNAWVDTENWNIRETHIAYYRLCVDPKRITRPELVKDGDIFIAGIHMSYDRAAMVVKNKIPTIKLGSLMAVYIPCGFYIVKM